MSYSEENGQVVLTMSKDEHDELARVCALAAMNAPRLKLDSDGVLQFWHSLNSGNPLYTPYPDEMSERCPTCESPTRGEPWCVHSIIPHKGDCVLCTDSWHSGEASVSAPTTQPCCEHPESLHRVEISRSGTILHGCYVCEDQHPYRSEVSAPTTQKNELPEKIVGAQREWFSSDTRKEKKP